MEIKAINDPAIFEAANLAARRELYTAAVNAATVWRQLTGLPLRVIQVDATFHVGDADMLPAPDVRVKGSI